MSVLLAEPPVRHISPTLLNRIATTLDEHGVGHGPLTEGPPNLNLNVSDHARVFVKVTRPADRHDRAATEVAAATWARARGITCPTPLLPAPAIVVDETDVPRAVTAWQWVQTVTPGSLVDRCHDVLGLIEQVSSTQAPALAKPWDLAFMRQRIRDHLSGRRDTVALAVLDTAETTGERVADLISGRVARWSHLDLHLNNVGWSIGGSPIVFDWESSGLAPIEADLSQLLRSIFVDTPDYAPSERARVAALVVAAANARLDVDWRLVAALVRFRCTSAASLFLVTGEKPGDLRRNLTLLESPLEWLPAA